MLPIEVDLAAIEEPEMACHHRLRGDRIDAFRVEPDIAVGNRDDARIDASRFGIYYSLVQGFLTMYDQTDAETVLSPGVEN